MVKRLILLGLLNATFDLASAATFVDNNNGTIIDYTTGLTWQKDDDSLQRDHATAVSYCADLTLGASSRWRLPTLKELQSLADYRHVAPAIDRKFFPSTKVNRYWSSTPFPLAPNTFYDVDFGNGGSWAASNVITYFVRCVRS